MSALVDMHTHSDNSPDGFHSVTLMCERAIEKGVACFAVTDHCEIDQFYEENFNVAAKQSFFDIEKARSVFDGQIRLLAGIEIGQAAQNPALAEKVLSAFPYDIVLGSVHRLPDRPDFAFTDFSKESPERLFDEYLDELLRLIEWGGFDVLAHLSYPFRYIVGDAGHPMDLRDYEEKVTRVLTALIAKGKGLEINTSGLRGKYGALVPDVWCLRLYRRLGGQILTVGSDAHRSEDIAANIAEGQAAAQEAGFENYAVYVGRRPVFARI